LNPACCANHGLILSFRKGTRCVECACPVCRAARLSSPQTYAFYLIVADTTHSASELFPDCIHNKLTRRRIHF
jgi:hypothetical protein